MRYRFPVCFIWGASRKLQCGPGCFVDLAVSGGFILHKPGSILP